MRKALCFAWVCLIAGAMLLSGCSTAGPYVTDVGYDGQGNLVVTKNTVVFDGFFGVVKNGDKPQTYVLARPTETGQRAAVPAAVK